MKNLDRGKQAAPPSQLISAYNQGKIQQDLESYRKENDRLQDEKEKLSEKLEHEQIEKMSFQERLEQAMRDLGIVQDERSQAIVARDQAISSRNSMRGKIGGLTSARNRLLQKEAILLSQNQTLKIAHNNALKQIIAANKEHEESKTQIQKLIDRNQYLEKDNQRKAEEIIKLREKFRKSVEIHRKNKAIYQELKQQCQDAQDRNRQLSHELERLKDTYKKLDDENQS